MTEPHEYAIARSYTEFLEGRCEDVPGRRGVTFLAGRSGPWASRRASCTGSAGGRRQAAREAAEGLER